MSRRVTRRSAKPQVNAAYYVGYVEDDETPEMIMRKFEEMERIVAQTKAQAKPQPKGGKGEMSSDEEAEEEAKRKQEMDQPLSMEQLQTVFTKTSLYSMNSLKRNNEIFFDKQIVSEDGYVIGLENANIQGLMFDVDYEVNQGDMLDFFPQQDSDYLSEDEFFDDYDDKDDKKKAKRVRSSEPRRRSTRAKPKNVGMSRMTGNTLFAATQSTIKCKAIKQPFDIDFHKIPAYPIPRSWGLTIAPYKPKVSHEDLPNFDYMEGDILTMKHKDYFGKKTYTGILMDTPFSLENGVKKLDGTVSLEEFEKLPIPELMPAGGILFMWVPPELTMQVNKICVRWGFLLAEHGTWIMKDRSGGVFNEPTGGLAESKSTLLLFRRIKSHKTGAYFPLAINHQRTSDSFFDFVRYHSETGQLCRSDYQYRVSEILIKCFSREKDVKMLYMWAPKDEQRQGWHVVCDTRQQKFLADKLQPLPDKFW